MRYIYEDVQSGKTSELPPADSIIELMHQHEKRFIFHTEKGSIVMRYMPLRLERLLSNIRKELYPNIAEVLQTQRDLLKGIEGLDAGQIPEDTMAELERNQALIQPSQDLNACGVIVAPAITSLEDYYELHEVLSEDERLVVEELISILGRPRDPAEYDDTAFNIAEKYNIEMVDKTMIENMTVSQAHFFATRIQKENDEIERIQRGNRI